MASKTKMAVFVSVKNEPGYHFIGECTAESAWVIIKQRYGQFDLDMVRMFPAEGSQTFTRESVWTPR